MNYKAILPTFIIAVISFTATSQNRDKELAQNGPFASIGKKSKVLTLPGHDYVYSAPDTVEYFGWGFSRSKQDFVYVKTEEELLKDTVKLKLKNESRSRWLSVDPMIKAYESPYSSFANNPVVFIDPDGQDTYLLTSATGDGTPGHTYLAVDNYKSVQEPMLDKVGKVTGYKTVYVPDGSVTVYSFGPENGNAVNSKLTVMNDTKGNVKSYKADKAEILKGQIKGKQLDGVLSIKTDKNTDDASKSKLDKFKEEVNSGKTKYNAIDNNCSDMAADAISKLDGFEDVTGKETISPKYLPSVDVTTPNKLFTETANKIGGDKNKGTVNRKSDALKKDWIDAHSGGKDKDRTPGK
jgi:hypothetical protein